MLAGVPKAFIFSEDLDVVYISELHRRGFTNMSLHEGDVEGHHVMYGVGG